MASYERLRLVTKLRIGKEGGCQALCECIATLDCQPRSASDAFPRDFDVLEKSMSGLCAGILKSSMRGLSRWQFDSICTPASLAKEGLSPTRSWLTPVEVNLNGEEIAA